MEITAKMVKELRDKTNSGMMDCKKALAECSGDLEKAVDWLRQKGLMTARKRAGRATREGLIVAGVSPDQKKAALVELNCETDFVAKNEAFQKLAVDIVDVLLTSDAPADTEALLARPMNSCAGSIDDNLKALVGTIGENMNLRRFAVGEANGGSFMHTYIHGPGRLGVMIELAAEKPGPAAEDLAHNLAMHIAAASPVALTPEEVPADILEREKGVFRAKLAESGKPEDMWDKIMVGQVKKFYSEVVLLEQAYVKDDKKTITQVLKDAAAESGKVEIKSFSRFQLGEELPGEESGDAEE
ncbi:translation elongation factor Ts [Deltaproteobacteria bacterium OttesenSCG-928-M10]|nr:translation elongation factor Ts [Deltaproteobacteria bacterium OttesenSCG-928-M10]